MAQFTHERCHYNLTVIILLRRFPWELRTTQHCPMIYLLQTDPCKSTSHEIHGILEKSVALDSKWGPEWHFRHTRLFLDQKWFCLTFYFWFRLSAPSSVFVSLMILIAVLKPCEPQDDGDNSSRQSCVKRLCVVIHSEC